MDVTAYVRDRYTESDSTSYGAMQGLGLKSISSVGICF